MKKQNLPGMRINRLLSDSGYCSRREADRLIEEGRVTIDGRVAVLGDQVPEGSKVAVDGKEVLGGAPKVYLALNKPSGIVCTTDSREPMNVIDYLNYPERVFPIGRLDRDSSGLLLLTSDGDIVNRILRAAGGHEKEYHVYLTQPVTTEFLSRMASGVEILDRVTLPCRVWKTGDRSFGIVLVQGINRQIRRMCDALGYRVQTLTRVRVMNITLDGLEPGHFRKLSDDEVAELVRGEQIDILVDLAGHSAQNRLSVFARRPAPVAATWIGYPNTTGLEAIDYRITDPWCDPPGTTEHLHSERLIRLPHGFSCYQPPSGAPAVAELPAARAGYVTFGSFNALPKIRPAVIAAWSGILRKVPGSKLILKSRALGDADTRRRLTAMFAARGVDEPRIELAGALPSHSHHLELYNRIDIALDTFPYHGTTTTCEALWMGLPVIVRAGETHVSRVGVSLLERIGLGELAADSEAEYIEHAVTLAGNPGRLAELRAGMRERMANSPVANAGAFTRDLEDAYRRMWEEQGG
jgi:pseudouridine synthase